MKHQIARNLLQKGISCNSSSFCLHFNRNSATATASADTYNDSKLANAKPFQEMPHLPMLPFIGSAWLYWPFIGKYSVQKNHEADRLKHQIYGDVMREKFGPYNVVISFNPEDMEVISRKEGVYPSRPELTTLTAYRNSRREWYKETGILTVNGKEWWDLRSKVQKHIMKPKAIQSFLIPMQNVARDLVKKIHEERDRNNEVPDLLIQLYKWALESVSIVGLDTRLGTLAKRLEPGSDGLRMIESVQTMFDCMNELEAFTGNIQYWKFFPTPMWRKFTKSADVFTEIAFKYINRSLEALKNKKEDEELTLLQNMLLTKGLDVSGAMVTVADMLMAGIDTTSHTVGFTLYHLAKNPEKQEKLFEEINQSLPSKDDFIDPETFAQLRYLKCCLKESIRLDPIARGNARTLEKDAVISGYRVPAGTPIFVALQQVYRNEKYFKNANQFLPERWLGKDERPSNPYAYIPFGIGTRACIGRRLAELEMICLVTQIIRNFKVEYHHEDIGMLTRMVNIPDRPLRLNFIER